MRRLLLLASLFVLASASARAQLNKYTVECQRGAQAVSTSGVTSTSKHPQSYPGAAITIYQAGSLNPAVLYSDAAGTTPLGNPGVCSNVAEFVFYTSETTIDWRLSPSGETA